MFTNKSWKVYSDKITDEMDDVSSELILFTALWLMKGAKKDFQSWYGNQIRSGLAYQRELHDMATKKLKSLDKDVVEAYSGASEVASKELGREVKINPVDSVSEIRALVTTINETRNSILKEITANYYSERYQNRELWQTIFDSVDKVQSKVRVAYTHTNDDGETSVRNVSYRAYIDMRVRTDIQHQATELMLEGEGKLFRATSYPDCAPDHRDYQGKVYVKEKFKDEYPQYQTVEWVVGSPVYLTTRPNCRHILIPIKNPEDRPQVSYRDKDVNKNYKLLEQQRLLERNVRDAKAKKEILKAKLDFAQKGTDLYQGIVQDIRNVNGRIAGYNASIKSLVDNNYFLKRQRRRENPDEVSYDLGVKLQSE